LKEGTGASESFLRILAAVGLLAVGGACAPESPPSEAETNAFGAVPEAPQPPPAEWEPLIGEYAANTDTLSVLENEQTLYVLFWKGGAKP
jgi:hypothetical protein